MKIFLVIILMALSFSSCQQKEMNATDYVKYVNENLNGLFVNEYSGEFEIILQYLPWQYVGLMNNSIKNEYSNNQYFLLKIQKKNGAQFPKKDENYEDLIKYLSFNFQEAISLIEGSDTLNCNSFHFENNFGLTPYCSFLISFPNKHSDEDKRIEIDSKKLGIYANKLMIRSRIIAKFSIPVL